MPDHPQATLALVLGLVGLIGGLLLRAAAAGRRRSPGRSGRNAVGRSEASQGQWGGEGQAKAGMVLGIIGTVLLVLALIALVVFVVVIAVADVLGSTSTGLSGAAPGSEPRSPPAPAR